MINILVLNLDNDGVGYWRMLSPHTTITDADVNIEIRNVGDHTLPLLDPNFIRQYQIIVYNKKIPFIDENMSAHFNSMVKMFGIIRVLDIDDHWMLDSTHVNYKSWLQNKGKEQTIAEIEKADYVITTTPIFAKDIMTINKNVVVIPNAVNLKEQQWLDLKTKSDKTRFLWGGGISHLPDLRLLTDSFKQFDKEFLAKSQFYLCGYDLRMRQVNGYSKADWKSSPWTLFEDIFTNNFKYVTSAPHNTWLRTYDDGGKDTYGVNPQFADEFYQRRWTKPILLYGTMYNEADVALAPLKSGIVFNLSKSQLKIIESGAHRCPVIASNTGPYTIDDIDGKLDGKPKGFTVEENDKLGWYKKMKWFTENPNAIVDYGNNLYDYIRDNYSTDKVNRIRIEFYKSIVK